MAHTPRTLRLPFWLVRRFDLARLLAQDPERSWSRGFELLEQFKLSGPEREFALELLRRKTNLWLYRCNQRLRCGDFIIVNMSAAQPAARLAHVVELKQGAPLSGSPGVQMADHAAAVAELVQAGVLDPSSRVALWHGDPVAVTHVRGRAGRGGRAGE